MRVPEYMPEYDDGYILWGYPGTLRRVCTLLLIVGYPVYTMRVLEYMPEYEGGYLLLWGYPGSLLEYVPY